MIWSKVLKRQEKKGKTLKIIQIKPFFLQDTFAPLADRTVNYIPKHDTKKGDEMGKNVHNQNCNQEDRDSKS